MKYSIFISILLSILLFSGCTIDWNDEKDAKITQLEKQIQDDTFKKKGECLETMKGKKLPDNLIKSEIFYSRNNSSCFFVFTQSGSTSKIVDIFANKILFELLINDKKIKKITGYNGPESLSGITIIEGKCLFNKKVRELKGDNYPNDTDYFSANCNN